ncbi:DUF3800 domain-containing protein [Streptomyces koyangensis]
MTDRLRERPPPHTNYAGTSRITRVQDSGPRPHRSLPLYTRRVLEDPVMQDSRYSQFIQAADMVGYAAFHHLMLGRPEVWPKQKPLGPMSKAYRRLAGHWLPGHGTDGIVWVDG